MARICDQLQQVKMLHVDGYVILRNAVRLPDDTVARLLHHGQTRRQTIFNYNDQRSDNAILPASIDTDGGIGNDDGLRSQAHMNVHQVPWLCAVRVVVQNAVAHIINNRHVLMHWAVLISWPGCHRQQRHCDHDPATFPADMDDMDVPMAVVVALQPETSLLVWPGCIRGRFPDDATEGTRLLLDRGDVVIFRGDLVHAGDAYTTVNGRIHLFADAIHVRRRRNETYLI